MGLAAIALVSFVIAFIIGLPTFLVGCNTSFPGLGCIAYNEVRGVAYEYKFEESKCTTGGKAPRTYDCYYSYVKFKHVDNNSTLCQLTASDPGEPSEKSARVSAFHYKLGSTYYLLQTKANKSECTTGKRDTWIAGFSFLIIAFLCLLCSAIVTIYNWYVGKREAGVDLLPQVALPPPAVHTRRNAIVAASADVEMHAMPSSIHSISTSEATRVIPSSAGGYHIV